MLVLRAVLGGTRLGGGMAGVVVVRAGGLAQQVGLWPQTPQSCAGLRMEAPMSLPSSSPVKPAASAAAAPLEEPPGVRPVSQGLPVVPWTGLKRRQSASETCTLRLPNSTAPADCRRCTSTASRLAMLSL